MAFYGPTAPEKGIWVRGILRAEYSAVGVIMSNQTLDR